MTDKHLLPFEDEGTFRTDEQSVPSDEFARTRKQFDPDTADAPVDQGEPSISKRFEREGTRFRQKTQVGTTDPKSSAQYADLDTPFGDEVAEPEFSAVPTISGTVQEGATLTAATGTWSDSAATFSYQWYKDGTAINGATAATYVPVSGDVGGLLKVRVTAANAAGSSYAESAPTVAALIAAPTNSVAPSITGTAQVGQTLTAVNGTWAKSPTYTYQWQQDAAGNDAFVNIGGATTGTYAVLIGSLNNKIRVRVTGTNAGGSLTVNSAATTAVIAA